MNAPPARLALAALAAAALLTPGLERAGISSPFADPVSHIRAQDETTYANSALDLAQHGHWLTPRVMGRFLLYKPPLLVWLSAASLRAFGWSLASLRLPPLLAAIAASTLVFAFHPEPLAALAALLLLLADPLWHTFARLCYTDMPLVFCFTAALFCLARDPRLERRAPFYGFAAALATGIMVKNIAGLLPFAAAVLYCLAARPADRPRPTRLLTALALALAAAAPWHLYQIAVHPSWFFADYIQVQLLNFGVHPPAGSSQPALLFYGHRLFATDPLLALCALAGLIPLARNLRQRRPAALLLASWLLTVLSALAAFHYRNLPYALMAIPPLALTGAGSIQLLPRARAVLPAFLAAALLVKAFFPSTLWGLSFGASTPIPEAAPLRAYYATGRANGLVLADPADEFYSATLPGLNPRYLFLDPTGAVARYDPHYVFLGITVTTAQFNHLDRALYAQRLRSWGLASGAPLATAILAATPAEATAFILAHPELDFDVPATLAPTPDPGHTPQPCSPGRVFLLSNSPRLTPRQPLPVHW
jgi:4-amino-4-deoxy-L-arabinose transferase-like glycosyltransferase